MQACAWRDGSPCAPDCVHAHMHAFLVTAKAVLFSALSSSFRVCGLQGLPLICAVRPPTICRSSIASRAQTAWLSSSCGSTSRCDVGLNLGGAADLLVGAPCHVLSIWVPISLRCRCTMHQVVNSSELSRISRVDRQRLVVSLFKWQ